MYDRKELKAKAKAAFTANYWKSVGVAFIMMLITGTTFGVSSRTTTDSATEAANAQSVDELVKIFQERPEILALVAGAIFTIILATILISTLIDTFLTNPLEKGCKTFFLRNSDDSTAGFEEVKKGFGPDYMRTVKTLFLKDLYIFLWSLLLIIPGMIKTYEYSQVHYILAEDPDISPKDALLKSKEMMNGHKKEAFVFDLSFILWDLLSVATFGLAHVFYVGPYEKAADAEYYKYVKNAQ